MVAEYASPGLEVLRNFPIMPVHHAVPPGPNKLVHSIRHTTLPGQRGQTHYSTPMIKDRQVLNLVVQTVPCLRADKNTREKGRGDPDHLKGLGTHFVSPSSAMQRMRAPGAKGMWPRSFVSMKEGGLFSKRAVNIFPCCQGNFGNNVV